MALTLSAAHYNISAARLSVAQSQAMDRKLLEQRFSQAQQAVCLGFELIAEQRNAVFALDAWGQDATVARQLLRAFEEMQGRHLDDLETARVQLEAAAQRLSA